MATRLNARHTDMVREKIKASQLINRLQDHAFGELALEPSQIKAIEVLLKKSVPDLSAIQVSGDPENPIAAKIEMVIVDTPR